MEIKLRQYLPLRNKSLNLTFKWSWIKFFLISRYMINMKLFKIPSKMLISNQLVAYFPNVIVYFYNFLLDRRNKKVIIKLWKKRKHSSPRADEPFTCFIRRRLLAFFFLFKLSIPRVCMVAFELKGRFLFFFKPIGALGYCNHLA